MLEADPSANSTELERLISQDKNWHRQRNSRYHYGWLLWLAITVVACLPPLDVSPFQTIALASAFIFLWVVLNVSLKQLVLSVLYAAIEIFFREMGTRNKFKVPREGNPVIFVCAPHHNQFLDPFVVMLAVGRADLCFLAAAKSMRRRIVGALARILGSIPVERAQDVAVAGTGLVWLSPEDGVSLQGQGTKFATAVKKSDAIAWGGVVGEVAEVVSDDSLLLKRRPNEAPSGEWQPYKVMPHIDHSVMFSQVHSALAAGKAVGIFPEGGSHDKPSLLPLKAGIAIAALGAIAKHRDLPLKIVPIGIHYFSGHRFRSRVFLDIGDPLSIPQHLVELYQSGSDAKRQATSALMGVIENALAALTVSAPDYDTLEFFWMMRRLVKTGSGAMSLSEQVTFARNFSTGYASVKDTARVARAREMTREYSRNLKSLGLRDYQVARVIKKMTRLRAGWLLLTRSLLLLVFVACSLPMLVLGLPVLLITRCVAWQKARQAVKASSVKLHGRDVVATWKVMVALLLVPLLWLTYTMCCCIWAALYAAPPWDTEICLLFFFLSPFVFYVAIHAGDRMMLVARSLPPLAMCLIFPTFKEKLLTQRRMLLESMKELVDENGWRVPQDIENAPASSAHAAELPLESSYACANHPESDEFASERLMPSPASTKERGPSCILG